MIEKKYKQIIEDVQKEISKDAHLCHVFIMPVSTFDIKKDDLDLTDTELHVGYFNKESKKIFSYKYFNEDIEKIPEQEIFQREQKDIKEIDLNKININIKKVLEITKKEILENFKETVSLKTMIVLQDLHNFGVVWNVTILRRDFKTVNVKIDAMSGEIKHTSCNSLIDLGKSSKKAN